MRKYVVEKTSKEILKAINQRKIKEINRSVRGAEFYERSFDEVILNLRKTLRGDCTEQDPRLLSAADMATTYYQCLSTYQGKSSLVNFKNMNKKAVAFWFRVYQHCKNGNVDPTHFIKAQFVFFKKAFGTYPKLSNLLTQKALQRARDITTPGHTVAFAKDSTIDVSDLFKQCDKQVRDVCRAQGLSRKDFYKKLVITGAFYLPLDFLVADPVYSSALQED